MESQSWHAYWAHIKPVYGLDLHHQGLKYDESDEPVPMVWHDEIQHVDYTGYQLDASRGGIIDGWPMYPPVE